MKNNRNKQSKLVINTIKILFVALLINFNSIAQEVSNFETVKPLRESNTKSKSIDLYSLYYDNYPSFIIGSEKNVSDYTKSESIVLEVNVSDLQNLSTGNFDLKNIQLIRVIYNSSDITSKLDLSDYSNLSNLQAIVFQCDFNCDSDSIKKLISLRTQQDIPIYYLVSIPQ